MQYHKYIFILLSAVMPSLLMSQEMTPVQLIEKSIQYHDPNGKLLDKEVTMDFIETRPGGEDRKSAIGFNIKKETFQMASQRDGVSTNSIYDKGEVSFLVNGESNISDEIKKKYRLNEERVAMMKNYYQYLWLMPMKLKDPGTIIDPDVKKKDFFGKQSLEIRVSYSAEVGKDIWYFYFHPETYALQGYRFYHDESKNDGEYILLEGESTHDNVRLPKKRTWYTHNEDKLLGADILEKMTF